MRELIDQDNPKLLTDLELLCHLCCIEDDGEVYKEFVDRFYNDIKAECERRCKARKLDKHIGIQVAHETFEKVRRHKTFRKDEIKNAESRKGILAYLIRVSVNLFNDHHRKEKKQIDQEHYKTYFDDLIGTIEIKENPAKLKQIKDLTLQIFKRLNQKEQKVVLADAEYKKHQKYLPDAVTERLADELGVKKETVRKIRERAIQKVKTAINEFNQA
jgi:DNA-directed RNA polymerase specialized sigma24 family protein